jgi:VWFA-related protein
VQPPAPKPAFPPGTPAIEPAPREQNQPDQNQPGQDSSNPGQQSDQQNPAPPLMPPVQTLPPGTAAPRNQIPEGVYKLPPVSVNFVQLPVMVKDADGRRVDGLRYTDFTVKENGRDQNLTFFSSDPLQLSVAVLIDVGMPDVDVQKVNQTYGSLVGAFSPYDEIALYTYSTTVTQLTDFTENASKLTAALNEMKLVRGRNNGPAILGGPLASGPTVNGLPVGTAPTPPVNTPPREVHVLNDAILQAALDLSKRGRDRRKVIFVISDGRELGSKASYHDVLRVLETRDIQVKAVVLDTGALPVYKQVERLHHLFLQGYSDILPRYTYATGGGQPYTELTRNAIEDAYQSLTSDARNQYTLGYVPLPVAGASPCRSVEVIVHRAGLKVTAKDAYCPVPMAR